jgi:hypothetical protein
MDRFLRTWSLRSLLVIALMFATPLGRAFAQEEEPPAAEEPPADLGPSNEAVAPDFDPPRPIDVSPSEATGLGTLDPNGVSPSTTDLPEGGEGGG